MHVGVAIVCVCAAWVQDAPAPQPADDPAALLRAGDLPAALRAAEARLATHPDDAGALAVRGRVLLALPTGPDPGAVASQAFDDLSRAVEAGVADPATLMALSRAHAWLRDATHDAMVRKTHDAGAREASQRALAAAEAALQAAPADAWARKVLADVLLAVGQPERAAELFAQVLATPPADAPAAFLADVRRAADNARAQVVAPRLQGAMDERRWDDAVRLATELMALVPDDPQPCEALAWARAQLAVVAPDAAAALELRKRSGAASVEALRRDVTRRRAAGVPVDLGCAGYQAAYRLALVFISRGQGEAGIHLFEQMHALLPPGRARAWVGSALATERKEAGDAAAAIAGYRQAIADYRLEPVGSPADRAFLAKAEGDCALVHRALLLTDPTPMTRNACVAAFRASMSLAPPGDAYTVYARVNLARFLASDGDVAQARRLLREALDHAAQRTRPDGSPDERSRLTDTLNVRRFLRELPG